MPDARPLLADLDAGGDAGDVVVLAGPDRDRYPHGVLGDDREATRLLVLERHTLEVLRSLEVQAPHVLEDIAPRPWYSGRLDRPGHGSIGTVGAQLVVVEADRHRPGALRVAAAGEPLGTRMRWLSPSVSGPGARSPSTRRTSAAPCTATAGRRIASSPSC